MNKFLRLPGRAAILSFVVCLLMQSLSAAAWFNGNVSAEWPTSATGSWTGTAGTSWNAASNALEVVATAAPLAFTATTAQDLADADLDFVSYTWKALPTQRTEVPVAAADEKAGIVLVDDVWYGLAKDPGSSPASNVWVSLNGPTDFTKETDFKINIQKGSSAGEALVTYQIGTTVNPAVTSVVNVTSTETIRLAGAAFVSSVKGTYTSSSGPIGPTTADVSTVAELRAAIQDTTSFPDGSTITLAATTFDIGASVDTSPIAVSRPLTLAGLSRTGTIVFGGGVTRCLTVTGADVVISNLTVSGGYQESTGGQIAGVGITMSGARTKVVDVDVRNCAAKITLPTTTSTGNIRGVGICDSYASNAEIRNCRICDCTAWNVGGGNAEQVTAGAGIYSFNDTGLKVIDTLISGCSTTNTSTRNSSYNVSAASGYGGAAGTYIGCSIISNVAWRTLAQQSSTTDAAFSDATLVSNCLFRGNLSTRMGAVVSVPRIVDSSFIGNISSNGYGSVLYIGNVQNYPVIERCRFEKNIGLRIGYQDADKARGGAICMDYVGGVVVSNCVFRGNEARNNGYGGAIGGRSGSVIKVYGSVFEDNVAGGGGANIYDTNAKILVEHCLFTGTAKCSGGAIYANMGAAGEYLTVRNSLFKSVDATGNSVFYIRLGADVAASATFENCSMLGCQGALFSFYSNTTRAHTSLTGCCLWANYNEGLDANSDITYSYLSADNATTRDAARHNIVSGNYPGYFKGMADLRLKSTSALCDKGGAAKAWMQGESDMGDGSYTALPSATNTIAGVTYEAGARIVLGKTHPRVVGEAVDIGAGEYQFTGEPDPEGTRVASLAELRAGIADQAADAIYILEDGVYDLTAEATAEPLKFTRSLELKGASRTGTAITAGGQFRCVEITAPNVVLKNLTLKDGFIEATGNNLYGAGVYSTGSGTTLEDLDISGCYGHLDTTGLQKTLGGIGVYLNEPSSTMIGCRVTDCGGFLEGSGTTKYQCAYGAGVYCGGDSAIRNTLFRNCCMTNSASSDYSSLVAAAYRGTYVNCAFLTNVAWRAVDTTCGDCSGVANASLVSNCLFRGNFASRQGAVGGTVHIKDSSFIDNISSNGYLGAAVYTLNGNTYPIIERCLFEGNIGWCKGYEGGIGYKSRGGALGTDYIGGFTVSNCVFRNNETKSRQGGAIGGRSGSVITVYGSVFDGNKGVNGGDIYNDGGAKLSVERCLFTGTSKTTGGAIYADLGSSGYLTVRNSLFNQVDATGCYLCYIKSTGGAATYEQCSFVGCLGTMFGFNNNASGSYASLAGCCLYGNGSEGLSQVSDVTYCYLATDKAGTGNIVSSSNPGFVDYPKVLRLRKGSDLQDKGGAAESWMGDGSRKGVQDMGDGSYSYTPSATFTIVGETYSAGARISFGRTNPRVVNARPDIGCFEWRGRGLVMSIR